jgi:hypothetical protein
MTCPASQVPRIWPGRRRDSVRILTGTQHNDMVTLGTGQHRGHIGGSTELALATIAGCEDDQAERLWAQVADT